MMRAIRDVAPRGLFPATRRFRARSKPFDGSVSHLLRRRNFFPHLWIGKSVRRQSRPASGAFRRSDEYHMTQVVLIRSGATVYDEQQRIMGVLDVPLSDRGIEQAERMAERLPDLLAGRDLSALYCGPGECVLRTAETIGRAVGLRPKRIVELRNLDQGLWQGLQLDEIKRRNAKVYRQWMEDPTTVCPPQGESIHEGFERVKAAIKPLIRRHKDETIGLVVAEPLARIVACYLKREPRLQLDDQLPICRCERIEVPLDLDKNGDR